MDKIKFVNTRFETMYGYQLNDGSIIDRTNLRFDTPFNLETGEIYTGDDLQRSGKNGLPDDAPEGFTTLNNLNAQKLGHEVHCYDEHYISLGYNPNFDVDVATSVAKSFNEHGFNVTVDAVMHNYNAWRHGMKAGYRDEGNGYHLFTPCGLNPLSFSATTLHDLCKGWQTTYEV